MTLYEEMVYCHNKGSCINCKVKKNNRWIDCQLLPKVRLYIDKLERATAKIVRCKDCIYCEEEEHPYGDITYFCKNKHGLSAYKGIDPLGFCSLAQLKSEECETNS